jgi:hypothetical protein
VFGHGLFRELAIKPKRRLSSGVGLARFRFQKRPEPLGSFLRMLVFGKLEPWQTSALAAAGGMALLLLTIVGREIYYATNPDRRPKRRKRRRAKSGEG